MVLLIMCLRVTKFHCWRVRGNTSIIQRFIVVCRKFIDSRRRKSVTHEDHG